MSRFAIAAAVAGLLAGKNAWAQQVSARPATHGVAADGSVLRDVSYAEPAVVADEPPAACETESTYKMHRGLFGRCLCCEEGEDEEVCDIPFRCKWFRCCGDEYQATQFFNQRPCQKHLVDGWFNVGGVWNPYRPADRFNGPQTWQDRANETNLQEFWTNFHKDVDTGGCGWDWGYKASVVYGTNARFLTQQGLEDRINKTGPFYALALPNLYGEVGLNDLKVKVGHFGSPVGFYGIGSPTNYFATLPYTYQYGEPFTHTGFLAQYQMTDDFNAGVGLTAGWDNFDQGFNRSVGPMWLLSKNNLLKCGDNLSWFGIYGNEPNLDPALPTTRYGAPAPGFTPRYMQSLVYQRPVTDNLQYVLQSDFGYQREPFGPAAARQNAYWYGLNQYWYYKWNNCLSYGLNTEWFRDDGGFRVGGFLPNFGNNNNGGPTGIRGLSPARSGYDGSFYRIMVGSNLKPHPNLLMRSALVWDWYSGPLGPNAVDANGRPATLPFLNGSAASRTQVVLSSDVTFFF